MNNPLWKVLVRKSSSKMVDWGKVFRMIPLWLPRLPRPPRVEGRTAGPWHQIDIPWPSTSAGSRWTSCFAAASRILCLPCGPQKRERCKMLMQVFRMKELIAVTGLVAPHWQSLGMGHEFGTGHKRWEILDDVGLPKVGALQVSKIWSEGTFTVLYRKPPYFMVKIMVSWRLSSPQTHRNSRWFR